ncbi:MAG: hypothetical protein ACQERS_15055 [Bacteroidota bacterium]
MKKSVIFILLALPLIVYAQEKPAQAQEEFKFGIGAAAGFSTGYGLSFRYWPTDWGLQLTTAPYYSNNDAQISFGATTLKTIKDDGRIKLFMYWGNHILYEKYSYYYNYPYDEETDKYTTWISGIGPGFEFTFLDKVSFNLMFGIATYVERDFMLNMTAETGLYYKF